MTGIPQDLLIEGILHAARKRKFVNESQCARLADLIKERELKTVKDVKAWLQNTADLGEGLARGLKRLLPGEAFKAFGDYPTIAHLADGGMGSVWISCNNEGKLVVVKTLKRNLSKHQEEFNVRFDREASIMMSFDHDNVVRCLDAGKSEDGTLFMVLEFIDAGDLKDLIQLNKQLGEALALSIFRQMVSGLVRAHELNLIHRDIKPANIFVCQDGAIKLADFGIARSTDEHRTMLTMEGALIGSPLYMSPEQAMGEGDLDIRSDIYAMGCVLFFMLAGKAPYDGKNVQEILHKHNTAPVPNIRDEQGGISKETAAVIEGCMAKEKDSRYSEPLKLLDAVDKALEQIGMHSEEFQESVDLKESSQVLKNATANLLAEETGSDIGEATMSMNLNRALAEAENTLMTDVGAVNPDDATMTTDLSGGSALEATIQADLSGKDDMDDSLATMMQGTQTTAELDQTMGTMFTDITEAPAQRDSQPPMEAIPTDAIQKSPEEEQVSEERTKRFVKDRLGQDTLSATAATVMAEDIPEQIFQGNSDAAMRDNWIVLEGQGMHRGELIFLIAKDDICMGKLKGDPVDLCLRNFPIEIHKNACLRISRRHARCWYDDQKKMVYLQDLQSGNGSMLDGIAMSAMVEQQCFPQQPYQVVFAKAVNLQFLVRPQTLGQIKNLGAWNSSGQARLGLDSSASYDNIIISRPENRPEVQYAMVLRQVSIGSESSNMPILNHQGQDMQIALFDNAWVYKENEQWHPLIQGQSIRIGQRDFIPRAAQHDDYHL